MGVCPVVGRRSAFDAFVLLRRRLKTNRLDGIVAEEATSAGKVRCVFFGDSLTRSVGGWRPGPSGDDFAIEHKEDTPKIIRLTEEAPNSADSLPHYP